MLLWIKWCSGLTSYLSTTTMFTTVLCVTGCTQWVYSLDGIKISTEVAMDSMNTTDHWCMMHKTLSPWSLRKEGSNVNEWEERQVFWVIHQSCSIWSWRWLWCTGIRKHKGWKTKIHKGWKKDKSFEKFMNCVAFEVYRHKKTQRVEKKSSEHLIFRKIVAFLSMPLSTSKSNLLTFYLWDKCKCLS